MKKIILAALVAVSAMTANAQVWVGGSLGFNTTTNTLKIGDNSTDETADNFELAPEIGYNLDENWAIAVKIGYVHSANQTLNVAGHTISARTNSFAINPYVRYTFLKAGNFSAFVDGGLTVATTHFNGSSDVMSDPLSVAVGFNPGIAYAVSNKVTLVAHIGDLSYNSTSVKTKNANPEIKYTSNKFNLNLTNAISFGAYYNF